MNSQTRTKNKHDKHREAMYGLLMQPAIQNNSPDYHLPPAVQPITQKQLIVVPLEKLEANPHNPRITKNPKFDEIKASIKARGLDHPPKIIQYPGSFFYTIADGGNTRLQALKELHDETQDPRFENIECILVPFPKHEQDLYTRLDELIGHLAENEIRGDLSFIEKALGIQQAKALYEAQLQETLSHRKLAEKLTADGYPLSHQIIARMELCLTHLHPHIPNVLLNGLGKPQVEKLLAIYRNAAVGWEKYGMTVQHTHTFDEVWGNTLSPFDADVANFSVAEFQDSLIGNMLEAMAYQVSYDALKLEIDLEERKLQKLREKLPEITQRATESEQHLKAHQEHLDAKAQKMQQMKAEKAVKAENPPMDVAPTVTDNSDIQKADIDDAITATSFADNPIPALAIGTEEECMEQVIADHFSSFGIIPETERQAEAEHNDLAFANTGRQPISDIWKLYPSRKYKMDAFSIAMDIAEECGLDHLVQHILHDPVDYSFTLLPLDIAQPSLLVQTVYGLLSMLSTDGSNNQSDVSLSASLLLGTSHAPAEISDLMLVRLFRLIRIVRHLQETDRQGA